MPIVIEEKGPFARAMRAGDELCVKKEGSRTLFEAEGEVNTRIMPTIGTVLEFEQPVAYENEWGTGNCLPPRFKTCTYMHLWLSPMTGESVPVLKFPDRILLLEHILAGQTVHVLSV